MNRKLSIACLQYSSAENEKHTLETIKDLIDKSLNDEAELITLPECATSLQKNSFLTNKPLLSNSRIKTLLSSNFFLPRVLTWLTVVFLSI